MGIALAFAREGATVINADLNPPPETQSLPDNIVYRKNDVTSRQQWDDLFAFAKEKYGGVDILVNNAGTSYRNKVWYGCLWPKFSSLLRHGLMLPGLKMSMTSQTNTLY